MAPQEARVTRTVSPHDTKKDRRTAAAGSAVFSGMSRPSENDMAHDYLVPEDLVRNVLGTGGAVGDVGHKKARMKGDQSRVRGLTARTEDMDLSDTTQPLDKEDESDKKKRLKRNRKTLKCLAVKTRETRPFLSRAPVPLRRSASQYGDLCDPDFTPEWEGAAGSILSASPDPDTVAKLRNLYDTYIQLGLLSPSEDDPSAPHRIFRQTGMYTIRRGMDTPVTLPNGYTTHWLNGSEPFTLRGRKCFSRSVRISHAGAAERPSRKAQLKKLVNPMVYILPARTVILKQQDRVLKQGQEFTNNRWTDKSGVNVASFRYPFTKQLTATFY
ncbi:hypothetical protein QBC46DRAFT_413646 [Diplogelasinospora grovesii]|uniref:Uncharacterized protein n=1 Tax=Diplogelasinospora grovesii TaxID=303347 RepID=A0AAN6MXG1_9PEZI|nr:hypothetical protein QBC46DRAFT_413646 [Diplogelasinospora grovesii]